MKRKRKESKVKDGDLKTSLFPISVNSNKPSYDLLLNIAINSRRKTGRWEMQISGNVVDKSWASGEADWG